MADTLVARLKRRIARRYPGWVAAYHQARHDAEARRYSATGTTSLGFRFDGPQAMTQGAFEPEETAFLLEHLRDADVFVDVGANAGYFVCLARQRDRHVVAVEPMERNLELLFRNLQSNGWDDVEVFPVGLGSAPRLATIYGEGTGASLIRRWSGVSEAWRRTIPLSTLDVLLDGRFHGQRLLIKIDVEGAEHEVLSGAMRTLARRPAPVWLIEICFNEHFPDGAINPRFRDVFELFWQHGYGARSLDTRRAVGPGDVARWLATGQRDFGRISYVFEITA